VPSRFKRTFAIMRFVRVWDDVQESKKSARGFKESGPMSDRGLSRDHNDVLFSYSPFRIRDQRDYI